MLPWLHHHHDLVDPHWSNTMGICHEREAMVTKNEGLTDRQTDRQSHTHTGFLMGIESFALDLNMGVIYESWFFKGIISIFFFEAHRVHCEASGPPLARVCVCISIEHHFSMINNQSIRLAFIDSSIIMSWWARHRKMPNWPRKMEAQNRPQAGMHRQRSDCDSNGGQSAQHDLRSNWILGWEYHHHIYAKKISCKEKIEASSSSYLVEQKELEKKNLQLPKKEQNSGQKEWMRREKKDEDANFTMPI